MNNLSASEKKDVIKNILVKVDDINVILETPSYQRRYTDGNYSMDFPDTPQDQKHFFISAREKFRKLFLTNWYKNILTAEQIEDITEALLLTRAKIADLFK